MADVMERADDALRSDVLVREPAFLQAVDADERARVRRVDEATVADVDPDVARLLAGAVGADEEDEVARLETFRPNPDGAGGVPLRGREMRQRDAELREDVLDQARAVESGLRARAAPLVWDAEVL